MSRVNQESNPIPGQSLTEERRQLPHVVPRHPVGRQQIVAEVGEDHREADAQQMRQARENSRHLDAPAVDEAEIRRRLHHERKESPNAAPLRESVDPNGL